MFKRSQAPLFAVAALFAATACGEDTTALPCGHSGEACCAGSMCQSGLACSPQGQCAAGMTTGANPSTCGAGALWSSDRCPCMLTFTDRPAGAANSRKRCTVECSADSDCPLGGGGGWSCAQNLATGINSCACTVTTLDCSKPMQDSDCDGTADATQAECSCPSGGTKCGEVCTDTSTDNENCGGCNTRCTNGTRCVNGRCACPVASCPLPDGGAH